MITNNSDNLAMKCQNPLILFSLFIFAQPVFAEECIPWQPGFTERGNLSIGRITIDTADVFDLTQAKENTFLHRGANKLHIETKDSVIKQQLLVKSGDPFELRLLKESERLLRENRYIKDASVVPVELCGKKVNIKVSTRDKWTLTPGVSFGRSGGKNKSGVEIEEHNLFGLGKGLSLSYKNGSERNSTILSYLDPQLLGSRHRLFASIQDNSDGKGHEFELGLPFYKFDSHHAWGISTSSIKQQTSLYDKGIVTKKISEEKDVHSLFYGWSKGREKSHVSRFKVGWQHNQNKYGPPLNSPSQSLSVTESYPWFEYEFVQDKYIKKTNFKTMGQIEDVSLGTNYSAGLGLLSKQLGSDDNQLKLSGRFSKGYELGDKDLGFIEFDATSYLGNGILEGEQVSLKGEWYSFKDTGNDLYLSGKITQQSNLLPGEQILLGGETGLRGYPTGYQTGDKSVLLTAEKRFHFDWYPLHIAKLGAVAFTDVGTAWGGDNEQKILADIGLGLRIVPTRSSSEKSLHLDLAIPLTDRGEVDSIQFLIKTRKSF